MSNLKIIILGGKGQSTNAVYHSLSKTYKIEKVIIEDSVPPLKMVKNRIKRLGYKTVFGQIIFIKVITPIITILSSKRINKIQRIKGLNFTPIPESITSSVSSVNTKKTRDLIKSINPDIIIVNGTRIISKRTLNSSKAKFINTHVGITPKYRGVHGGYWAVRNNDIDNFGVTVHLVDEGIDTGNIIYQKHIVPSSKDNFSTYPLLQLAEGLELLKLSIQDITESRLELKPSNNNMESKLWYHPTAWSYLYHLIRYKVK